MPRVSHTEDLQILSSGRAEIIIIVPSVVPYIVVIGYLCDIVKFISVDAIPTVVGHEIVFDLYCNGIRPFGYIDTIGSIGINGVVNNEATCLVERNA